MTPVVGYTEMKDSGIEWVGMIPKDWDINILFQLVSQVKNKNKDLAETNLLSLSYGKIKRKNIDHTDGLIPASFDSQQNGAKRISGKNMVHYYYHCTSYFLLRKGI